MLALLNGLDDLNNREIIYWFVALAGSGLLIIQFALSLLGAHDHDFLEDDNLVIDAGKVKWLSKQGLTAFLMMFGWVGLTCMKEFALSTTVTMMISFTCGIISIFVTGFLFKVAKKLRSSGTVFRIEDAIDKEAVVYQNIAKDGAGKISISLHNLTHEIDAVSLNREDISSFTRVKVIKKADEKTVVVVPIK